MITAEMTPSEVIEEIDRLFEKHNTLTSQDVGQLISHFKLLAASLYEAEQIIDIKETHE